MSTPAEVASVRVVWLGVDLTVLGHLLRRALEAAFFTYAAFPPRSGA